jgi:hypothetical protein
VILHFVRVNNRFTPVQEKLPRHDNNYVPEDCV